MPDTVRNRPRVLVVGGHDLSGAGVDADRAGLAGLDVEAAFVVTARTDQTDREVRAIGERDPDEWGREAARELERGVAAIKLGLLPGEEHVRAARELVRAARSRAGAELPVVLDPVIAASSGGRFLDARAVAVMQRELLAESVIVTPNLREAAVLAGGEAATLEGSLEARTEAARAILALGARAVVLKGGHGAEDPVRDLVLEEGGRSTWLEHARVAGGSIRGSGCRFASRTAARMALGASVEEAARDAGEFVAAEIGRRA